MYHGFSEGERGLIYADQANRCQTELQKTIGSPAQAPEVREVSKDLSVLCGRMDALDKKIDLLSLVCPMFSVYALMVQRSFR